jgi:hypothetical protein
MRKNSIGTRACWLILLVFSPALPAHPDYGFPPAVYAEERENQFDFRSSFETYRDIERLYRKWEAGLFGSRGYYRRKLHSLLVDSIGKGVVTDYNYVQLFPEALHQGRFHCRLEYGSWLIVSGPVDSQSLARAAGEDPALAKSAWRSGRLLSIFGKIKKFRLEESPRGVTLVLDVVRFRGMRAAGAKGPGSVD